MSLTVLRAGHARVGQRRASTCNSFFAPHPYCLRTARINASTDAGVRCGHPCGARLRSASPASPAAVPVDPLVASRPCDAVALAELRHRPLTAREVPHELHPLLHRTRFHPGHLLPVNDVPGLLLTMNPARTDVQP